MAAQLARPFRRANRTKREVPGAARRRGPRHGAPVR